jgi:hypothetical protein
VVHPLQPQASAAAQYALLTYWQCTPAAQQHSSSVLGPMRHGCHVRSRPGLCARAMPGMQQGWLAVFSDGRGTGPGTAAHWEAQPPVVAQGAAVALRTRPLPQPTASSLVVESFFSAATVATASHLARMVGVHHRHAWLPHAP